MRDLTSKKQAIISDEIASRLPIFLGHLIILFLAIVQNELGNKIPFSLSTSKGTGSNTLLRFVPVFLEQTSEKI